jgi:hypothetical protein
MDAGDPKTPLIAKTLQAVMPMSRLISKPAGATVATVKSFVPKAVEKKVATNAVVDMTKKAATKEVAKESGKGIKARAERAAARKAASAAASALGGSDSDNTSSSNTPKYLSPLKLGMDVKINKPEAAGTKTGTDTRVSNLYRKSFEGSMKEEAEEEKKSKPEARRFLKPAAFMNSKVKINAPKPSGVVTGVDARMRKYERDMYTQQNESVISQIMTMVNEDVTEMQLNIGENSIKINNTIAKKVVGVYESLNEENKKKMENMLNEDSIDSFKKLINFAVRQ